MVNNGFLKIEAHGFQLVDAFFTRLAYQSKIYIESNRLNFLTSFSCFNLKTSTQDLSTTDKPTPR